MRDWESLQRQMREDAAAIEDPEGGALLNWFADGAMTLLGYHVEKPTEQPTEALGIFSVPGAPTDEGGAFGAMRYFERGGEVPLMAKAERSSTVHRRVPLDLIVVPIKAGGKSHRASASMPACGRARRCAFRPRRCRSCASRLKQLDKDFGFDPKGHCGKAFAMRSPRSRATW